MKEMKEMEELNLDEIELANGGDGLQSTDNFYRKVYFAMCHAKQQGMTKEEFKTIHRCSEKLAQFVDENWDQI